MQITKEDWLKNRNVVVLDSTLSASLILIKVLLWYGFDQKNIFFAKNQKEAEEIIKNHSVSVLIVDPKDLIFLHASMMEILKKDHPTDLKIFVSDDTSQVSVSNAVRWNIDHFWLKPFDLLKVKGDLDSAIQLKIQGEHRNALIQEINDYVLDCNLGQAERVCESVQELFPDSSDSKYYRAHLHLKKGELERALHVLHEGIRLKTKHYRCRKELVEILISQEKHGEAFEQAIQLMSDFPGDPEFFNKLIKLAVKNNRFDVLDSLAPCLQYYQESQVPELDSAERSLTAAFMVGAKYYLKANDNKLANHFFVRALHVAHWDLNVMREVLQALVYYKQQSSAQAIFTKIPEPLLSNPEIANLRRLAIKVDQDKAS